LIQLTQSNLLEYFFGMKKNFILGYPTMVSNVFSKFPFEVINLYNFKNCNSNTLFVTIGDSWTWGVDLSGYHDIWDPHIQDWKIDNKTLFNTNHLRLTNVYGNMVSEQIDSDWLNLSVPGCGNFTIARLAQQLGDLIPNLNYKKIIVVCTLTEIGRGFNTEDDCFLDHNKIMQSAEQTLDINALLAELNKAAIGKITDSLNTFPHVQLLIGTNFVDAIGFDTLLPQQILQKPWYQLLDISFDEPTYVISFLAWENFVRSMEDGLIPKKLHSIFKSWILDLEKKEQLKKTMMTEKQTNFLGALHPDSTGHRAWAEYIIQHIC
jgi:hypothetical protein